MDVSNKVMHIDEFASTFNDLIDSHNAHEDDITWVKIAKIADLEDRSRRNNVQIRGIPNQSSSLTC